MRVIITEGQILKNIVFVWDLDKHEIICQKETEHIKVTAKKYERLFKEIGYITYNRIKKL